MLQGQRQTGEKKVTIKMVRLKENLIRFHMESLDLKDSSLQRKSSSGGDEIDLMFALKAEF